MVLERVLRYALISEDTYMEKSEIVTPKSNTQVYWLYNELANLLTKQKSYMKFFRPFEMVRMQFGHLKTHFPS